VPLRLKPWGATESVSVQCGQAMAIMKAVYGPDHTQSSP